MKKEYERIVEDIEQKICDGNFRTRERLPSIRELCAAYRVSQNTAVKAYEVLKARHLIYSVPQSGCYVLESRRELGHEEADVINFARGNPRLGKIHAPDIKHCLDRAIDLCNENSAEWHEIYGAPSLRNLLVKYLRDFQIFTAPDNVFVNLGVQQALTMLTQMKFPNLKDAILLEEPTFRYYNRFLKSSGVRVVGVRRDASGLDLERLEQIFKEERVKFFYTVPNSHNPLGTCLSREQRKNIALLAEKYDVYVVEDDYFGDVRMGANCDAIASYGDADHHIYLKSFIKIIPWLRIGITVLPKNLLEEFSAQVKKTYFHSYFSPSMVSQATLEIYLRSNILKKHAAVMKKETASRLQCLRSHFTEAEKYGAKWSGGESGFYSYLSLPEFVDESEFTERLKRRGVLVIPGCECFYEAAPVHGGIRLSVARTDKGEIARGLAIIYEELCKCIEKVQK